MYKIAILHSISRRYKFIVCCWICQNMGCSKCPIYKGHCLHSVMRYIFIVWYWIVPKYELQQMCALIFCVQFTPESTNIKFPDFKQSGVSLRSQRVYYSVYIIIAHLLHNNWVGNVRSRFCIHIAADSIKYSCNTWGIIQYCMQDACYAFLKMWSNFEMQLMCVTGWHSNFVEVWSIAAKLVSSGPGRSAALYATFGSTS